VHICKDLTDSKTFKFFLLFFKTVYSVNDFKKILCNPAFELPYKSKLIDSWCCIEMAESACHQGVVSTVLSDSHVAADYFYFHLLIVDCNSFLLKIQFIYEKLN